MTLAHFHNPWLLLLLLAVPLIVWWHHRRDRSGALTFGLMPRSHGSGRWRLHLPFYSRLAACALLIVALARPQLGYRWQESSTQGIDIEIALDISGSMGAEDFHPRNRLTVAKQVVENFIARRPADRIGLVVFSGAALTRAPLTTDHKMLAQLLKGVHLNSLPDGTAIGIALADAAARLKDSQAKSKVIVLVTDGVNNAGAIDPMSAATVCKGLGIKVYTVGVGRAGRVPVPVPVQNPFTGEREIRQVMMNVRVDDQLLRKIADRTGGHFYRATDSEQMRQIFAQIDKLEKSRIKVKQYVRYREAFQPLAWTALALLLLPLATTAMRVSVEP